MPSPDPAKPAAVTLFYSYAHEDEPLRDELAGHLKILERRGLISAWHDRQILPGQVWHEQIDQNLTRADLVLLLLSKDFISSDYIWGVELQRAMQRQQARECEVVPIVVRAVDIDPDDAEDLPFLKLQALPPDLTPVTSWPNRDEAWTQVAKGLRATVNGIRARKRVTHTTPVPAVTPAEPITPTAPPAPEIEELSSSSIVLPAPMLPPQPPRSSVATGGPHERAEPVEPDRELIRLVQRVVDQVDEAQRHRGGAPLYDHHRYLVEREAQALIDRPDPMRVLWVDDQPDNNLHERAMLARLQIEVVAVTDTAQALARIAADTRAGEPFDLVISDWSRPAEGPEAGLRLLQALRSAGQAMPLVVYHGEFEAAARQRRADAARAAGALGEAVLPNELMALVQRALSPGG